MSKSNTVLTGVLKYFTDTPQDTTQYKYPQSDFLHNCVRQYVDIMLY